MRRLAHPRPSMTWRLDDRNRAPHWTNSAENRRGAKGGHRASVRVECPPLAPATRKRATKTTAARTARNGRAAWSNVGDVMVTPNDQAGKTPTAEDAKELRDPDVKLCPAVLAASFDAFLAGLAKHPADDDLADLFSDWLDAQVPTPVKLHCLPRWVRLAWFRNRPKVPRGPGRRCTQWWAVVREINDWLAEHHLGSLDHWGQTLLAGRRCLVTEPYSTAEDVRRQCRALALLVGGIAAVARRSAYGHGTVRGLIFPPPR